MKKQLLNYIEKALKKNEKAKKKFPEKGLEDIWEMQRQTFREMAIIIKKTADPMDRVKTIRSRFTLKARHMDHEKEARADAERALLDMVKPKIYWEVAELVINDVPDSRQVEASLKLFI